jgi:glycosyltransferase involved in cell wall biosynthesis
MVPPMTVRVPKVSLLVPCFNGARYLGECLDSALAQSYEHFEVVIVDDSSSDATLGVARQYAARDSRVRVFSNRSNLGLVGNWNRAIELCRGQWIKFVFQDDSIAPTCLEDLLNAADATNCPFAFGRRDFLLDDTVGSDVLQKYRRIAEEIERLFPASGFTPPSEFCRLALSRRDQNFVGEPVAVLFRRDLVRRFRAFNPNLIVFCDMEYWMRIGVNTGVAHAAKKVASFRIHGDSTTAKSVRDRHYRMFVLDHLVVDHEFAFHPAFAPLRAEALKLGIDLRGRLQERIRWAKAQATKSGVDLSQHSLREFHDVEAAYPNIRRISTRLRRQRDLTRLLGGVRRLFPRKRIER